jgi:hypothetical protein
MRACSWAEGAAAWAGMYACEWIGGPGWDRAWGSGSDGNGNEEHVQRSRDLVSTSTSVLYKTASVVGVASRCVGKWLESEISD